MIEADNERRRQLMSEVRMKGIAKRRQVKDAQWVEVDNFVPTVNEHEADMVAGVEAYCSNTPSTEWTEQSVTAHVQQFAYDAHPGDEAFRGELGARLRNMIDRRRLNAGQMSHDMGWEDILHEFLSTVELLPGFRLRDAGEKWGMLRLKYDVDDRTLVADAERRAFEQSLVTCECCGEPGTHRKGPGWWKTVCEKHARYYAQMSDPFREIKARYSDVYQPDIEPYARELEFKFGWAKILKAYLDTLRGWNQSGFVVKLRWGKEKFGSLRMFTDLDYRSATRQQVYWVDRLNEWARRKSLTVCDMCGRPGRLRWGRFLATRCDEHAVELGSMRREDGIVLDADRQRFENGKVPSAWARNWSDREIGLAIEGSTWDGEKQFRWDFAPMLADDVELPDDDVELAQLRKLLWLIDQSIGRHHAVEFKLSSWGDRTAYVVGFDPLYKDEPVSDVEQFQRERIVDDIHHIMSHPEC